MFFGLFGGQCSMIFNDKYIMTTLTLRPIILPIAHQDGFPQSSRIHRSIATTAGIGGLHGCGQRFPYVYKPPLEQTITTKQRNRKSITLDSYKQKVGTVAFRFALILLRSISLRRIHFPFFLCSQLLHDLLKEREKFVSWAFSFHDYTQRPKIVRCGSSGPCK